MSFPGRVVLESAWILHRRPYRDTSEIVDLFTANFGRVAAVAKGSRRGKRRMPLEPFQPLHVSWAGRGEMVTLSGAEPRGPAVQATGRRLLSMFYVNELVLRLTVRQDPNPDIFTAYEAAITGLGGQQDEAPMLRLFERDLLQALGYGLLLQSDVEGRPVERAVRYNYRLEEGPRRVAEGAGAGLVISGDSLLAIQAGRFRSGVELREARTLLRAAVDHYLGGRPLKTRQVLNAFRRRAPASSVLAK